MFWNKYLVIFSEGVCNSKELFVECHTGLSNVEHLLMINGLHQSFSGVYSHRRHTGRVSLKKVKWACNDSKEIG